MATGGSLAALGFLYSAALSHGDQAALYRAMKALRLSLHTALGSGGPVQKARAAGVTS